MADLDTNSSCSRPDPSGLRAFCSENSMNNTEICNNVELFIFFFKADCYISHVFYPLTAILIGLGTLLNLFSLYCFLKMNKRNSQNVYLSVLSLVDTINLHINFTLPMLRSIESFDDRFRNLKFLCRFTGVLTEFFLIFPTWIVVLLTFERLICILWPLKRRSSYSHIRAKISIVILAVIVLLLSLYRLFDLKGIDQVSVFSVVACSGNHTSLTLIRNLNLMIWAILPECLTLIMSLIIIYQIKLATQQLGTQQVATQQLEPNQPKGRQSKYNQATKTVLLISILFLIFHTPTGIMIALNLFYQDEDQKQTLGIIIILVSRKLTILLYEISLCCKFFIYHQTLHNFKTLIHLPISRYFRRTNSAKIGPPSVKNPHDCPQHRTIHFGPPKRSATCPGSQTDSLTKSAEEQHHYNSHHQYPYSNRHQRTSSTSLSRTNHREHQPLIVTMKNQINEDAYVTLPSTLEFFKSSKEKKQSVWSNRSQITL